MAEVDQGDCDEAASGDQLVGEHLDLADGQVGARKSGQGSTQGQGLIAGARDVDAHAVRGARMGAHSAHLQTPARLEEDVPGDGHE